MPAGMRPSATQWAAAAVSGKANTQPLVVTTGGFLPFVAGYYNGMPAALNAVAVCATYAID